MMLLTLTETAIWDVVNIFVNIGINITNAPIINHVGTGPSLQISTAILLHQISGITHVKIILQ
jgi:hypothetical protein